MDYDFWRSPSNIIPQVEEKWDVQERDGYYDVGTGQRCNPWEADDGDICMSLGTL